MNLEIVQRAPLKVVGLQAKFISVLSADATSSRIIPDLWDAFIRNYQQIQHRVGNDMYGVIWGDPLPQRTHPDQLNYIAGIEVTSFEGQPEGFVAREVPGGTFAKAVHAGTPANLKATLEVLYREALPQSGFAPTGEAELEVYGARFNPARPESELDIYVSVRPASAPRTANVLPTEAVPDRPAVVRSTTRRRPTGARTPKAAKPKSRKVRLKPSRKKTAKKPVKKPTTKPARKPARRAKKPARKSRVRRK